MPLHRRFESFSTQPPETGTSFAPGLLLRSVTSTFSPAGGKDTSPATTSLKPEIPWRSLSKRGHRDLARRFPFGCYLTQPVSPAWLGHSPSSTSSDSPQALAATPALLFWLGQGQTGLGTEGTVEMSLMAVSLFQVVLKEYHSEPSRAAAETGGKCSTPQPSILGLSSPRVQRGTSPGLCWECCSNSPGNLPYPKVSSSRQPLQEEPSHAGTGSRTPLTHCILSSML